MLLLPAETSTVSAAGGPAALRTFDPCIGVTYGHLADGGLLQEELKVAHFPGVRRRVRGFYQVRRRGHELHDTSHSVTLSHTQSHSASAPQKRILPISALTSYEQLSPASRQLSLICQAWICPTSLSETSVHAIPNSLQRRARLQMSHRKSEPSHQSLVFSRNLTYLHWISCKFELLSISLVVLWTRGSGDECYFYTRASYLNSKHHKQ